MPLHSPSPRGFTRLTTPDGVMVPRPPLNWIRSYFLGLALNSWALPALTASLLNGGHLRTQLALAEPPPEINLTASDVQFIRRVNQTMTQAPVAVRQEQSIIPIDTQLRAGKAACQYLDGGFLGTTGVSTQAGEQESESTEKASKAQYVLNLYLAIAGIATYCPNQLNKP